VARGKQQAAETSSANVGFEAQLWAAADLLRGNIDPSEYKHVLLGLIFLKYVSDAFEERRAALQKEAEEDPGVDLDDPEEYAAKAVFWLPPAARWSFLRDSARKPEIGELVDAAMKAIEDSNPKQLRGVLPRDYARPALDKSRLGQVIDLLSNVGVGGTQHQAKDTLGRVYEYCLGMFASAEGRRGGDYYTPRCVVRLLVEMLEPRENTRLYDPCCGSGGMFIQSERFIETHGGRRLSASVFGQEYNHTTWRLCKMNLAIRGIEADIREGDTFGDDRHPDLKADFVLANPPFNMSEWGGQALREDPRWQYGTPPAGNANYAWIQHLIYHLKPDGFAGFVMANGSLSSNSSNEGDVRRAIVESDLVDCIIALPGQLFYTTQIPVSLWFLSRNKGGDRYRRRSRETLFIDARKMGVMIDRTHRELTDAEDIARITRTYHAWRGEKEAGKYEDEAGFCKSATTEEIKEHGFVLTPGRYVGAVEAEDDGEPFEEKMARLTATLSVCLERKP
jgi:type I restriction enzyme M protein